MTPADGFAIGGRVALLIALVPAGHLVTRLWARISGWSAMAEAFPWEGGEIPNAQRRASINVGMISLHNVTTIGFDDLRLYLRAPWIVHLGALPPLAIPFSAMRGRERVRSFWRDREVVTVEVPGRRVRLILSAKNTAAFEARLPPIARATVPAP